MVPGTEVCPECGNDIDDGSEHADLPRVCLLAGYAADEVAAVKARLHR